MATLAKRPVDLPTSQTPAPPQRSGWMRSRRSAERFAWGVVGYNVLVVLWGALVRATGSGAGCGNHWPLCNGVVIPVSPTAHTLIEFTHRQMVTGSVLAMIALVTWVFRAMPKGAAARWFATASAVLLVNEAFLGALLVKLGYVTTDQSVGRMVVLSVHLSNTLLLLGALTVTARMAGTVQSLRQLRTGGARLAAAVVGLGATLLVGVSGSLAALGDTLFPAGSLRQAIAADLNPGSPFLIRLRWVHPASAVVAAVFVGWLVLQGWRQGLRPMARWVSLLLGLQFVLGVADVLLLAPAWMQMLHLLGADVYWVLLVLLAAETLWPRASVGSYAPNRA